MNIIFTKLPTTDGTIKISLDGGQSFTDYSIANIPEDGISLSDDQDFEKIRIKGPANLLKNLDVVSSVKVEGGSGGGGSGGETPANESPIKYLRAYVTSTNTTPNKFFTTEDIINSNDWFTFIHSGALNQIFLKNLTIGDNSFTTSEGTFERNRHGDVLLYAKDEQVEVEFISGYSTGITSYNFATNTDSHGTQVDNLRFNGSLYYDKSIECDLCIYVGSGRIGYYKIKQ